MKAIASAQSKITNAVGDIFQEMGGILSCSRSHDFENAMERSPSPQMGQQKLEDMDGPEGGARRSRSVRSRRSVKSTSNNCKKSASTKSHLSGRSSQKGSKSGGSAGISRSTMIFTNPYLNFLTNYNKKYPKKKSEMQTERVRKCGALWRCMDEDQRRPYREMAEKAKKRKRRADKKDEFRIYKRGPMSKSENSFRKRNNKSQRHCRNKKHYGRHYDKYK